MGVQYGRSTTNTAVTYRSSDRDRPLRVGSSNDEMHSKINVYLRTFKLCIITSTLENQRVNADLASGISGDLKRIIKTASTPNEGEAWWSQ